MDWKAAFPAGREPNPAQIAEFVASPLWGALCGHLEETYAVSPKVEYSREGDYGWNVKYRKGGRALCTLYPRAGFFICLVCVGAKQQAEAELALPGCDPAVQALYRNAKPFNGARWLMIEVATPKLLEDVKELIRIRANTK